MDDLARKLQIVEGRETVPFIQHEDLWPFWPRLVLRKETPRGVVSGILYAPSFYDQLFVSPPDRGRYAVFTGCTLFGVSSAGCTLDFYHTPEAIAEAGWEID